MGIRWAVSNPADQAIFRGMGEETRCSYIGPEIAHWVENNPYLQLRGSITCIAGVKFAEKLDHAGVKAGVLQFDTS
jgi:hypothetical protein